MATVYLAEDLKHRRKVALKVLRPELAAIIGAERFLKEIEVTANLQHPNILPLYDSSSDRPATLDCLLCMSKSLDRDMVKATRASFGSACRNALV